MPNGEETFEPEISGVGVGLRSASFARIRRGIGLRLLAWILLFSSVVTLILTVLQLYIDYRRDVGAIESRLEEIGSSYLGGLGVSLWNLDENQLRLQLEGILRLPDVHAAEIRESAVDREPLVVTAGRRETHSVIAREFPIIYASRGTQQSIGILYVQATLTGVYRRLRDEAVVILISQAAKTFLVSLFILQIFHRLVTRHLTAIAMFVGDRDPYRLSPTLALQRHPPSEQDDLDHVVAAINTLCANLQRTYDNLRASEQRFRDYAETASDWFWETGPDHAMTFISEQFRASGIDKAAGVGKRRWEFASDLQAEPEKWRRHMATLDRHEAFRDFVYKIPRVDGAPCFVSVSGKPLIDAEGNFLGYRGSTRDVTETVLTNRALRDATHRAEAANRAKSNFLANMSHELRTPLNAIIGFAEMMKLGILGDPDRYRSYASDIHESGMHLLDIIDDILDMARIEAGKIELQEKGLRLQQTADQVVKMMNEQVAQAGLSLVCEIEPDLPVVRADERIVRQILLNLLSNSSKFTPAGGTITLGIRREVSGGVEIWVSDTGIGIAPADIPKLMKPFTQLGDASKGGRRGTGLGLTLVRSLVELHGGSVTIQSVLDRGTTVTVLLPAARVASLQPTASAETAC
jgi:PAS domain S-box-containing protein